MTRAIALSLLVLTIGLTVGPTGPGRRALTRHRRSGCGYRTCQRIGPDRRPVRTRGARPGRGAGRSEPRVRRLFARPEVRLRLRRDGGLSKVDLLTQSVAARVIQAGNSIGGAISDDGRLVAVANYEPGGVRVFDADTLQLVADIPTGSKTIGLVDAPGRRFVFTLWDAGETWIADLSGGTPDVQRIEGIGKNPYDALITADGRFYIAGLFGEDGLTAIDLWETPPTPRRILSGYGRGEEPLPVYKMPHLEGWALASGRFVLPAVGRHEVLWVDSDTLEEAGRRRPMASRFSPLRGRTAARSGSRLRIR